MTDNVTVSNTPLTDYDMRTWEIDGKQHPAVVLEFGYPEIDQVSVVDASNALPARVNARFINSSNIVVTSSVVPQRLLAGYHLRGNGKVDIRASSTNVGIICVGASNVNATSTPPVGVVLSPGDAYSFETEDLYDVYVAVASDNDSASFNYFGNSFISLT